MKRKEGAFWVVQALMAVGVLALVSLPSGFTPSPTSRAQPGAPLAFASPVSPQGLQLKLTLNSSSIRSRGTLGAFIEVVNTRDHNVTVSVPPMNRTSDVFVWNGYDYVCSDSPSQGLATFALFAGRYSAGNVSLAGTPLMEGPPFVPPCPSYGLFGGGPVTFLPNGTQTTVQYDTFNWTLKKHENASLKAQVNAATGYCGPSPPPAEGMSCGLGVGLVGYWRSGLDTHGDLTYSSPAFTYFPPGEYTIVATDPWGQYLYATFVVQPPEASSSSSSGAARANTVVATVTETTTITAQASQPTTTYARPTTNCTLVMVVVTATTTTTTTVGAGSTTTVTATATSTGYAKTVTVTSCTYSTRTVTSTVTSTISVTP